MENVKFLPLHPFPMIAPVRYCRLCTKSQQVGIILWDLCSLSMLKPHNTNDGHMSENSTVLYSWFTSVFGLKLCILSEITISQQAHQAGMSKNNAWSNLTCILKPVQLHGTIRCQIMIFKWCWIWYFGLSSWTALHNGLGCYENFFLM